MTYENIPLARTGGVTTVTLNRPDRLNALHAEDLDDDTRKIILTGAGRAFSSGADLRPSATNGDPPVRHRIASENARVQFPFIKLSI